MVLYLKVRRAHFQDGLNGRQTARDFGLSQDRVVKILPSAFFLSAFASNDISIKLKIHCI